MRASYFCKKLSELGIDTVSGVPDSLLKNFCEYLDKSQNGETDDGIRFKHFTAENEGGAAGICAGAYLATGRPACLYMQNSGIGNVVNPICSLFHRDVYDIPLLMLVGWRGEPGVKDEPQHVFQGKATIKLLEDMDIETFVVSKDTTDEEVNELFETLGKLLKDKRQCAVVVKKGTFVDERSRAKTNGRDYVREEAIGDILKLIGENDPVFSTTGKISREVYEQSDKIYGNHSRCFLTVGSMGHTSMIAFGYKANHPEKRVFCIDGDGAVLMHMGSMAFIAEQQPENFVHIVINNNAHESVGGMDTAAKHADFAAIAKDCGYKNVYIAENKEELEKAFAAIENNTELTLIEVRVALGARDDLGRPKETPRENKAVFMEKVNG